MKRYVLLLPVALALVTTAGASTPTTGPDDAKRLIGRDATVCGNVESARYNENSDGQPTFMHFGGRFPQHTFSVRIGGDIRSSFSPAPETLIGKQVCVEGRIGRAAGNRPEIVLASPAQLSVR